MSFKASQIVIDALDQVGLSALAAVVAVDRSEVGARFCFVKSGQGALFTSPLSDFVVVPQSTGGNDVLGLQSGVQRCKDGQRQQIAIENRNDIRALARLEALCGCRDP